MSCHYKILSSEPQGYIMYCNQCNCYQLAFGVMVMNMQQDEFVQLEAHIEHYLYTLPAPEDDLRKLIQLPAFSNNCLMVLNFLELKHLGRLFEQAMATQQTEHLLSELSIRKEEQEGRES